MVPEEKTQGWFSLGISNEDKNSLHLSQSLFLVLISQIHKSFFFTIYNLCYNLTLACKYHLVMRPYFYVASNYGNWSGGGGGGGGEGGG